MTTKLCVAGHPIDHSKSPEIHSQFASQYGHDVSYGRMDIEPGTFAQRADEFLREQGGLGMNVTVPLKQEAYAYADEVSEEAQIAGAVNTIVYADGRTYGHNTDGPGFVLDLARRWREPVKEKRILVLGAGGSAMGLLMPIIEAEPAWVGIANRTVAKAEVLVQRFAECDALGGLPVTPATILARGIKRLDIIINTTAIGLQDGDIGMFIDPELVAGSFCYDLSYGAEARFARWAAEHGARGCADGLGMLVEQAAESYALWMGERPDTNAIYQQLR